MKIWQLMFAISMASGILSVFGGLISIQIAVTLLTICAFSGGWSIIAYTDRTN